MADRTKMTGENPLPKEKNVWIKIADEKSLKELDSKKAKHLIAQAGGLKSVSASVATNLIEAKLAKKATSAEVEKFTKGK